MTAKTTAVEGFIEITAKNEKLAEKIYLELNSRLNEVETDAVNWLHVGTMDHVQDMLEQIAAVLGLQEGA